MYANFSGEKLGIPGNATLSAPVNNVSPIAKDPGLLIPMTSPGNAISTEERSLPNN